MTDHIDHIDRAAEVIYDELSGKYGSFNMPTGAAQALDAAGLLASPERDAAVAARAVAVEAEVARLREGIKEQVQRWEAARDLWEGERYSGCEWSICNTGASETAALLNPTAEEKP